MCIVLMLFEVIVIKKGVWLLLFFVLIFVFKLRRCLMMLIEFFEVVLKRIKIGVNIIN